MALLAPLARRLQALFRSRRMERDLRDELQEHLARSIDELVASGLTREAAGAEALRAFGGLAQAEEACRDARGVRLLTEFGQDLRYGARILRSTPALTLVIVFTLAIAIGANTALFSLFDAVLLKSLPLPHPDRLVVISEETPASHGMAVSYQDFLDWRTRQTAFDGIAVSMVIGGVLTGEGDPDRVFGRAVTREFFTILGTGFELGRPFTAAEDRPNGPRAIVLSHALWNRRYGGDRTVVGRPVTYNGEPYTIVGVLPATFDYYGTANANNDIFLSLGRQANEHYMLARDSRPGLAAIGRMKPGVTIARARADLSRVAAALATEYPSTNANVSVTVRSLLDDYVGDVKLTLSVLLAAALLLLVVACTNVANLLLARAGARSREIAMRLALGAGRSRIVRQLVTESLLLAGAGGSLGLAAGSWGTAALSALATRTLPRMNETAIDWRVLVFTAALTLLAGLLFGVMPAMQTVRADVQPALKETGRSVTGGGRRLRDALVVVEIALSLALLIGAGLLVRSYARVMKVDPGYDARGVLTLRLRLPDAKYRDAGKIAGVLHEILRRIEALPGVEHAALATGVPFGRAFPDRFVLEGRPVRTKQEAPLALTQWVTPGYFSALRVAVIAGRTFTTADVDGAALVAVVDEEFARVHFPGREPSGALGAHIRFPDTDDRWREIVGVVRHVRGASLEERAHPEAYGPYDQLASGWRSEIGRAMDVAVRSSVSRAALVDAIRIEVHAVDPEVPLSHTHTLEEATAISIAPRVLNVWLVASFAAVALLLCLLGVYGVISYSVTERTREIGVRLALGADPRGVLGLVLRRALYLALAGSLLGLCAAFAVARVIAGLLYAVAPWDPATFAAVTLLLVVVSMSAACLPGRRAMRLDPLIALRHE